MTTAERILVRCEQAFGLTILCFWLLERLANGWWPVAILICLPHLPSGLPLPLLTYVRLRVGWRGGGWLLLGWLIWLGGSGFRFNWQPGSARPVRVVGYNLEGCPNGERATSETLRSLQADIYVLQEVAKWPLQGQPDLAYSATDSEFAVLSRYPVLSHRQVQLQPERFSRPCQVVDLQLPGGPLRIINMHVSLLVHGPQWLYNQRHELRQIVTQGLRDRDAQVANALPLIQGRCLVIGDFNGQPRDRSLAPLEARLLDSFRERGRGWGLSFESTLPVIRIDYIWHSPELRCLNCASIPSQASDHLPTQAEFADP